MFFCEFCEIFKNIFFTEHLWTTASVMYSISQYFISMLKSSRNCNKGDWTFRRKETNIFSLQRTFYLARERDGFLTNELRVTSYELRVTIYCTSFKLLFRCKLRVNTYCTSYELPFRYELRVITYCRSYELLFTYKLRVITYCRTYELLFTYELRVTIYYTSYELN